jgi:4-alpha-glucanotransferase
VELTARGIPFDYDRFCKPYITDVILEQFFGADVEQVKETFLKPHATVERQYELQDDFNTQKKVEAYFAKQEVHGDLKKLKEGLFDLISNVIFFEEPDSGGTALHFRISVETTPSFQQLDEPVRQQLYALYLDYFYYRQDQFWKEEALRKLPALKESTNMLICGEDLGMVPHCVPDVMQRLGILSLEIQRMPKNIHTEFFHPKDAPYLSVITPSTHDMSTVRAWWEEDRNRTQHFYNTVLGQWGEAPQHCDAWISRAIVLQHLYAPAMWAIFQLQDLLGMSERLRRENPEDERINIPAIPQHYWRYRMHLTLEQLLKEDDFNDELHDYIKNSGR